MCKRWPRRRALWFVGNECRRPRRVSGMVGEVCGMTAEVTKTYSILITDDDRDYREALRELVEPEGYRTVLASSGEEALDVLREEPIHLALFDMHMPRLTGAEAVDVLHKSTGTLPRLRRP